MKNAKVRLTGEQQDALSELFDSYGWPALIAAIEQLVAAREQGVLRLNIAEGVDRLVHEKLRAEGARQLRTDIELLREHSRKQAREERAEGRGRTQS